MSAEARRILITGANGMLGRELQRRLASHELHPTTRADLELADGQRVVARFQSVRPAVVLHGAAMTAVDACESQPEKAYADNAQATAHVAEACAAIGAWLIAISTDYVFPGDADRAYHEADPTGPRTVYGKSKLAGEEEVRRRCAHHTILRIAWLYGPGGPSFVHAMLRLGAQPGPPLKVVDDQRGNPTAAADVAALIGALIERPLIGTVHASSEGETTWCGLAREIFRLRGLTRAIAPCATSEFPRPAPRPANSRLEKRALRAHGFPPMPPWQDSLARFLTEHPDG